MGRHSKKVKEALEKAKQKAYFECPREHCHPSVGFYKFFPVRFFEVQEILKSGIIQSRWFDKYGNEYIKKEKPSMKGGERNESK